MARVWALLCLTAFAAVGYCQTDPCSVFPAECTLQPGLVFSANGSTVQHVGTSRYEYFNLTVRATLARPFL